MNPETFIEDDEKVLLEEAFRRLASKVNKGSIRQAMLINAAVDKDFIASLEVNASPASFAGELSAEFIQYTVSRATPEYHPLLQFLTYFTAPGHFYQLRDQERTLFQTILTRGQRNFKALAIRDSVGRLESPLHHPIGTAVLVDRDLLLTCSHIFDELEQQPLWIRFGYTRENERGTTYELAPDFMSKHPRPDHALISIKGRPALQPILPRKKILDRGQSIYLIHHPQAKPLLVSDPGQITEVGTDFIDHSISTEQGSSGAPIFDKDWQFVALHRGIPGTRRDMQPGTTEGIPLSALWDTLVRFVSGVKSKG